MTSDNLQARLLQARRDSIIDAAIETIVEQGFPRTTIKQIAKRAEVADGTIYNYFKNKDALLMAIVERLTEAEARELHFTDGLNIPFDRFIRGYIQHRMSEVEEAIQVHRVIVPEMITNAEVSERVNEQIYQPTFKIAEQFLAHLMAEDEMAKMDPEIASRLFAAPLMGLLLLRLLGDDVVAESWKEVGEAMATLLVHAFQKETNGRLPKGNNDENRSPYQYYDT